MSGATPRRWAQDDPWRQVYDIAGVFDVVPTRTGSTGCFAVAGDKHVQLFDAQGEKRGQLRTSTSDFRDWATEVEVNPQDTAVFAVVSNEGYVEVFAQYLLTPPRPRWTFRGHSGQISSASGPMTAPGWPRRARTAPCGSGGCPT